MEKIKKYEKGAEFENKVAQFFREKGYNKTLLRKRVAGKSGIKHEIDILIFDNLDQNKMLWACQCKYRNKQIGIKEIKEWIETCRDINIRPAFAALKFSSEAKKYAEVNGVFLITDEQLEIEPSQVIGERFLSWKEELEVVENDIEKVLFCLKGIYQTELLQNAEKAKNEPCDPSYAFGSLESFSWFKILPINTGAFNIPSEIGKVSWMIRSILENMKIGDLESFRINWVKCPIDWVN